MYGLGKNIPIIRFFHSGIDISGAVEPFIRDLYRLSGDFIAALHFLNNLSDIRLFGFVSRIHLHSHRHQVSIQEKGLPDDRVMPVLFGRPFLFIFVRQVNLKIVIRTVEKNIAEISLEVLLITMVKKFNIFL